MPDFAAGAMENWGLITYRMRSLLVNDATASPLDKQWVVIVIAHELAHQVGYQFYWLLIHEGISNHCNRGQLPLLINEGYKLGYGKWNLSLPSQFINRLRSLIIY